MKIISWNINGLRAVHAKGLFLPFVKKEKPDILCIQETKSDDEGRIVQADYGDFVLLNVYFPNGGSGPERLKYKLEFYDAFLNYIQKLRAQKRHVIFCGDVNTAHHDIDLARPKENEHNSGFLPEERAWLDTVAERGY